MAGYSVISDVTVCCVNKLSAWCILESKWMRSSNPFTRMPETTFSAIVMMTRESCYNVSTMI